MNIAIDGPAGAGKSTIAKMVAKRNNYIYVDTGALYRAIALYFIKHRINTDKDNHVKEACDKIDIQIVYEDGLQQVLLNSKNVSKEIRQEKVGNMASVVATKQAVRDKLLNLQRDIALNNDDVMDGRDIGTFVLPNADVKIYLTASVETRANRRYKELVEKGERVNLEKLKEDIKKRDYQDMHREIAPLKQAVDAVYLDSSEMNIEEVVQKICALIKNG